MTESESTDEAQTAMLLTQHEWDDLAVVCRVYLGLGAGWNDEDSKRRRRLCTRIVGAA